MSLKQCCATGSLHTGKPTGQFKTIHGLKTYVAEPSGTATGVVVIVPDAFGISLPNNQILADEYAKKINALVYLPDFMNGYQFPQDMMISMRAMQATGLRAQLTKLGHLAYIIPTFMRFLSACPESKVLPRMQSFLNGVRANEAQNIPLGAAGFCWGGRYVTRFLWNQDKTTDGKRLLDCGFVAHPAMVSYPGDIEKVQLPMSIAVAEIDDQMSPANAKKTEEILAAKTAKTKAQGIEHEYVFYKGVHHGFAVRADEDQKHEAEQGKKAEEQAVNWFKRWFAAPPPNL